MSAFFRLAVILAVATPALAGCGQKGPLFLPGDPSAVRSAQPAPAAPEESDGDEDDDTPPDDA